MRISGNFVEFIKMQFKQQIGEQVNNRFNRTTDSDTHHQKIVELSDIFLENLNFDNLHKVFDYEIRRCFQSMSADKMFDFYIGNSIGENFTKSIYDYFNTFAREVNGFRLFEYNNYKKIKNAFVEISPLINDILFRRDVFNCDSSFTVDEIYLDENNQYQIDFTITDDEKIRIPYAFELIWESLNGYKYLLKLCNSNNEMPLKDIQKESLFTPGKKITKRALSLYQKVFEKNEERKTGNMNDNFREAAFVVGRVEGLGAGIDDNEIDYERFYERFMKFKKRNNIKDLNSFYTFINNRL